MNMEVVTEKANPLMKRKEIVLAIVYASSTPSKADMQVAVAKQFGSDLNKVEITKIMSTHGKATGKIWASIWEEKEIAIYGKKDEPKAEEPKAEEPKAEEPKAEEPKEATPEEK
ncbi:MAG: hypothetical protein GOV02_01095 [Candidatus Aenigmarchaeota archaeon]|nr:hypothetical protein [Candidatus Aenigmarchaeota archaeon]